MQSERPQIHKMHELMVTVFKTLLECYMDIYVSRTEVGLIQVDNPRHFKSIYIIYLGARFFLVSTSSNVLNQKDIKAFKLKCLDFFIEGAKQIKKAFQQ